MTSLEFARATGATLRQLQYWHEKGILVPAMSPGTGARGFIREYSKAHVHKGKRLKEMSKAGLHVSRYAEFLEMAWQTAVALRDPMIIDGVLYVPADPHYTPRRKPSGDAPNPKSIRRRSHAALAPSSTR